MEDIKKVVYKLEIDDSSVAKVSDKIGKNLNKLDQGVQRIRKTSQAAVNNIVDTLRTSNDNEMNALLRVVEHATRKRRTADRLMSRITQLAEAGGLSNADMRAMQHAVRTQIESQQYGRAINQYGFSNSEWAARSTRVMGSLAAQRSREINLQFKQEQQAKIKEQSDLTTATRNANKLARQDAKREYNFEQKRLTKEQNDLAIANRNASRFARQDVKRQHRFQQQQATEQEEREAKLYGVKPSVWASMADSDRQTYSNFYNTHGYTVADNQRFNRMARKDAAAEVAFRNSEQKRQEIEARRAQNARDAARRSEERRRLGNMNRVSNITQHGMVGMSSFLGSFGGSLLGTTRFGSYMQPIAGFGATGAGLGSTLGAAGGTLLGGPVGGMIGGAAGMIGGGIAGAGIGTLVSAASMAVDALVGGVRTAISVVQTGGRYLLQQGITYERDLTKMGVLIGSEAGGKRLYSQIESLAIRTPYTASQLSKEGETLLGYGVDPTRVPRSLSQLGDIAGGDTVRLNRLSYAYGQVMSQGRLMAQELRQFSEAGVGASDVAQTLGITVAQLKSRMEAGLVGSDALSATINRLTSPGGRFFGMNERVNQKFGGQLNSLQESFEAASKRIGLGVIERYDLAGKTKGLVSYISDPENQKKASDFLSKGIDKTIQFFDGLARTTLPTMERAFNAGSAFAEKLLSIVGISASNTSQQNGMAFGATISGIGIGASNTISALTSPTALGITGGLTGAALGNTIGGIPLGIMGAIGGYKLGSFIHSPSKPSVTAQSVKNAVRQKAAWERFLPENIGSVAVAPYHPFSPVSAPNFGQIGVHAFGVAKQQLSRYMAGWMNPFSNTNPDNPSFVGNAAFGGLGIAGAMTGRTVVPPGMEALQRELDSRKMRGTNVLEEYAQTLSLVNHGIARRGWSQQDANLMLADPIQNIIQMGKSLQGNLVNPSSGFGSDSAAAIIQMSMADNKDDNQKMIDYLQSIADHTKAQKDLTERMMKVLEGSQLIKVGEVK